MKRTIQNNDNTAPNNRHPRRTAFTLPEVILSTAIMAILMVAAATAMKVSLQGYDENDKVSRAMQGARATIERLTRQLRTASNASFTETTETETLDGQTLTMNVTTLVITSPKDGSDLEQVQYVHRIPVGSTTLGKLYYYYKKPGESLTAPTMALLGEEDDVSVDSFDVKTLAVGSLTKSAKVLFGLNVGGREFDFSSGVALRGYEY
jgi:prepilin-type N-terminal cleavage/methylation domain-containing protein